MMVNTTKVLKYVKDSLYSLNPFTRINSGSFDFWTWMLTHPVRCVLWCAIVCLIAVYYPGYMWPLVTATTVASVTLSLKNVLRSGISYAVEPVVDGLVRINETVATHGFSVKNILSNAQKHSIGLMACVKDVVIADSPTRVVSEAIKVGSMIGMEQSLITTAIGRVANLAARQPDQEVITVAQEQTIQETIASLVPDSFETKRTLGIAGLALSLSGTDPAGLTSSIINPITKANTASKALEESFDRVEEYLNTLGVINSGKWAYFKEINERVNKLRPEYEWCNQQIAAFPARFCRPLDFKRFKQLKSEIEDIDRILRRNTCSDLKNGKIMVGVQAMLTQAESWDRIVSQVRSTNGIRPVPVGICLQGASQVGKSTLYQEIWRRVKIECFRKFNEDPDKYAAFAGALEWQTWNMQTRDDYDQGYGGQEATYTDDGFSDREHKDHPQWLSFISGEAIGTVQADLQSKGLSYQSLLVVVSCNNLPASSLTINNLPALHNRFPFTVAVKKIREPPKGPDGNTIYDPNFSHLILHMAPMSQHCSLMRGTCRFAIDGNAHESCPCENVGLEDIVTRVVNKMCDEETYFQNRLRVLTGDIAELQVDDDFEEIVWNNIDWSQLDGIPSGTTSSDETLSIIDEEEEDDLSSNGSVESEPEEIPDLTPSSQISLPSVKCEALRLTIRLWKRQVLKAYRNDPVTSLTDGRVVRWASCLRRKHDNLSFYEYAMTSGDTVFQFMASLGAWEVVPGKEETFKKAYGVTGKSFYRIFDVILDTSYIWSPSLQSGAVMYCCPYVEGTIAELDAGSESDREILQFLDIQFQPTQYLTLSDFTIFRLVKHTYEGNSRYKSILTGIHLVFADFEEVIIKAWRLPFADLAQMWPSLPVIRSNRWLESRNPIKKVAGAIASISKPILDCFAYVKSVCTLISDYIHYGALKLFDFLGFKPSEIIEDLLDTLSEIGAAKLTLLVLPIVATAIYLVIKFIRSWRGEKEAVITESQSYSGQRKNKFRADRIQRRKQQTSVFDLANAVCNIENKINYYKRQDCPFDNETTINAEGPAIDLHTYWAKPNKFPDSGLGNDWVILSKKHIVANPLYNKEQFVNEMEALEKAAANLDTSDVYLFERNFGPISGGSVPHAHIKLAFMSDAESSREMIPDVKFESVQSIALGGNRVCTLNFQFPFEKLEEAYDVIISYLPQTKIDNWFMEGSVVSDVVELSITLVGTRDETVDRYFTRKEVAKFVADIEAKKRGVQDTPTLGNILKSTPVPVKQQSKDDASLNILRNLTEAHTVLVCRSNVDPVKRDSIFMCDSTVGPSCAGIAIGDKIIVPAHLGKLNDFIKIFPLGVATMGDKMEKAKILRGKYILAKIVAINSLDDIAMAQVFTREEGERALSALAGGEVLLPNCVDRPPAFSEKILKHLMREDTILKLLEVGSTVVQWFPMIGALSTGNAKFAGTKNFLLDGKPGVRRWIFVEGIDSNIVVSQQGDCGGLLAVMNPKFPNKILGMHTAGNAYGTNAAIFSIDQYEMLLKAASVNVTLQMAGIVLTAHTDLPSDPVAGLGHTQIMNWPKIEWEKENDPFRCLISRSTGPDAPVGPDVLNVGSVRESVLPAKTHKNGRLEGKFADWCKPVFHGAFPLRMEPSVLSVNDSRLEEALPTNAEGKPSLLLKPNSVLAQQLPEPDLGILNSIYDQTLEYWKAIFASENVGYPGVMPAELIHEALNGSIERDIEGLELKASAGYPWCNNITSKKKSDLININEDGIFEIKDSPTGNLLKELLYQSIESGCQGRRITSFCTSKLKDTCVKLKHIASGKTRVFNCSSVEDVILCHCVYGRFRQIYTTKRFELNHAVGIDPMSHEWEQVYNYLNVFPNWFDVDYANYDKHLLSVFIRMAESIVIETIDEVCPDNYRLLRYVCAEKAINSLMLDVGSVWQTEHGNKSGEFNTTPRNSQVNFLMMFYCYSKIMGIVDLGDFKANVRFLSFGDDIVITVSDLVKDRFNFVTVQAELAQFGQEATPGNKEDVIAPFLPKEQITFLKRKFAKVGGMVVGPVDKVSLEAKYNWSKVGPQCCSIWEDIIENDLLEAALWGEEYYNYFRQRLLMKLSQRHVPKEYSGIRAHCVVSWQSQIDKLRIKRGLLSKPKATSTIEGLIATNQSTLYAELDKLDITALAGNVSDLSARVDQVVTNLQDLGRRVDTELAVMQTRLDTFETTLSTYTDKIDTLSSEVSTLTTLVDGFDERITALETEDTALYQAIASNTSKIIAVKTDTDANTSYLNSLKNCKTQRGSSFLVGMQYIVPLIDETRTAQDLSTVAITDPTLSQTSPGLEMQIFASDGSAGTISYGDPVFLSYRTLTVVENSLLK